MSAKDDHDKQLEEFVELDDGLLTLAEIEALADSGQHLARYEEKHQGRLYSSILQSLTHEKYPENEARTLWREILEHRASLNAQLQRDVGIPVASLDYLTNIKHKLSDPKIIEEEKSEFVAEASIRDELTGLYLRDVFDVVLKKELNESLRGNRTMCLLMIDIDDFKKINDTHGHLVGDKVLQEIGGIIRSSVREMDLAARYGGEELAIIMPQSSLENARHAAERIRKSIASARIDDVETTVSIGIAGSGPQYNTAETLIADADRALYSAKEKGKNQVASGS